MAATLQSLSPKTFHKKRISLIKLLQVHGDETDTPLELSSSRPCGPASPLWLTRHQARPQYFRPRVSAIVEPDVGVVRFAQISSSSVVVAPKSIAHLRATLF
jgi:hypothetical protein